MDYLENFKKILDSDAGFKVEDISQPAEKEVVDNRFFLFIMNVQLVKDKNDTFYTDLIKLTSDYINQLYDKNVSDFPSVVLGEDGEVVEQNYGEIDFCDMLCLTHANKELSEKLFNYVCNILEANKDVKLNIETLKNLLNRNPKLLPFSIEKIFLYRPFDYKKLVEIINKNDTLKKSNISVDDVYQLLLDTYQLNNNDVFSDLVKASDFNQNHEKIDEVLNCCDSKTFIDLTNIIKNNFNKDFDRFSFVKNRKNFCESLIFELLHYHTDENDFKLIHQILNDSEININYDFYLNDYFGQTDLKSIIALSKNPIIIKDLLSKKENIKNNYWHGEAYIELYNLYAIVGDYDKALEIFNRKYNYALDYFEEFDDDFNKRGFTYADSDYKDSIAEFISNICNSFKYSNVDYLGQRNIISQILFSDKVKYINLDKTLPILKEIFTDDDFKLLTDSLNSKYKSGNLNFVELNESGSFSYKYVVKVSNNNDVEKYFSLLNNKTYKKN